MAIRSGLGSQLGFAAETTYSAYTAPTRFLEFNDESLDVQIERIESQGIRAGSTVRRTARWARNDKGASGPASFEVADKGFGLLFKHALGDVAITTPGGATNARLHTHTLGDMDDLYLTAQKGVPDTGGTVRPFTFLGGVITEWEMALDVDALLRFTPTFDFRDWNTSQALETAAYPTDDRLYFYQQASIEVAGAAAEATSLSIRCSNAMKTDRWYLNGAGTKGLPLLNDMRELGGELNFEFSSMTEANRFLTGTPGAEVAVEALLTGRNIESGHNYEVGVDMPKCRFDAGMPTVGGPDVITISCPFVAMDDGSAEPITLTYKTTDTAS
jgi:hypothetical protein